MAEPESLRGDLSCWEAVETAGMVWEPSPSGLVWRRRLHRVGPMESGQVTSVVRFEPGASFPAHDHPGGEEILVLDGVFCDDRGDWPAGSYLLNPEGYRHAPSSPEGCELFVKLRQYAGEGRRYLAVQATDLPWEEAGEQGVSRRILMGEPAYPESVCMERWAPGARPAARRYPGGAEFFTLSGGWFDAKTGRHGTGGWVRVPPGGRLEAGTEEGCELYVKSGAVALLRDGLGPRMS